jgi:hypothetical protein
MSFMLARLVVGVLITAGTAAAPTKTVAQDVAAAKTYGEVLTARCPGMVNNLIVEFDKGRVLRDGSAFVSAVCACTKTKIEADRVAGPATKLSAAELRTKLQSPDYSALLQMHMLAAVLGCTSLELEKNLAEGAPQ